MISNENLLVLIQTVAGQGEVYCGICEAREKIVMERVGVGGVLD